MSIRHFIAPIVNFPNSLDSKELPYNITLPTTMRQTIDTLIHALGSSWEVRSSKKAVNDEEERNEPGPTCSQPETKGWDP